MGSNLSPGVTEEMQPRDHPREFVWEKFGEWTLDELDDLDYSEAKRAVLIGKAAILAEKTIIQKLLEEKRQEGKEEAIFEIIENLEQLRLRRKV